MFSLLSLAQTPPGAAGGNPMMPNGFPTPVTGHWCTVSLKSTCGEERVGALLREDALDARSVGGVLV